MTWSMKGRTCREGHITTRRRGHTKEGWKDIKKKKQVEKASTECTLMQ